MGFSLDSYLGVHTSAVRLRQQKAGLIATNLANADTPGYKARDINFAEALTSVAAGNAIGSANSGMVSQGKAGSMTFAATHPGHIQSRESADFEVQYRVPTQPSLDGNTVQTDVEQSLFTKNAINYQASLQLLDSRIKGLLKTIRGE